MKKKQTEILNTNAKGGISILAKGGISVLTGAAFFFVAIEINQWGGTTTLWRASSAAVGLFVPILWDAWKSFKDERASFEGGIDKRLDNIEQLMIQKAPLAVVEEITSSSAIAHAIAERALKIADKNRDTVMEISNRISELATSKSESVFTLAQQVSAIQIQLEILKRELKADQ